ncbi:hypothetical protein F889_01469 [Acinetobacter colistiniresistens]|uniref:DUF535 domain-containing protein n=1 Tax=Acinetobacter colistiniresistens TaxID=280145 RepID=N9QXL6_9GAMM|nr:DUF535 family protein [Acinetobacter colistiniresistens]ENX34831.1 hypothetical protein F889_01469 [Acinetobacter colistiniresistens]
MFKPIHYWLIDPIVITKLSYQKYLRYILRFVFNWTTNYSWVSYLNSEPRIKNWKNDYKGPLYLKLQYPYLSGNLNEEQRLLCLTQHYDWFFANIECSHHSQREVLLWRYDFESENQSDQLGLYLQFRADFEHEGEMALLLKLNDTLQYTLTFSYILLNKQPTFFVGGLQGGSQNITNPEGIKQLTKNLYGLRPKQLMLHGLSVLCAFYKVENVVGVSNENHAFKRSRKKRWRQRVKTNMDEFWLEFGAELDAWKNFGFEPLSNQIDLEAIPSKKRSQYRKRQLLLDQLVEQAEVRLSELISPRDI